MNFTKITIGLLAAALAASASLNVYFAGSRKDQDSVVLRINNQPVLTENKMKEILMQKYKTSTLHSLENSNVIRLRASENHISPPKQEELEQLMEKFPDVVTRKSGQDQKLEVYYIYKLYDLVADADKDIAEYYQSTFKTEPVLYDLQTVTGQDHQVLMSVLEEFKNNVSLASIDNKYSVNVEEMLKPSIADLKAMDTSSKGDYYHVMLDNHEMMLAYVSRELKYTEENKEKFKNFYFNTNYLKIRADILGVIKNEYTIAYQ
ncbi:hypothetical protein [Paenibacillus sp. CAA11]|uniref:hypothetical protein n=1 Tax=Paenibacillus sp. CAA11 TaxID=1532905 RepID=UPI00131F2884|nr:hypothetical protein [Paenibacillus sp. CAA11]